MELPHVAVGGKIKGGKSSILNALFARDNLDLLPTSATECTALPVRLIGTEREASCFTVHYEDGSHTDLPMDELFSFVRDPEPHAVEIAIYCTSPLLQRLSITDLPGWGSVLKFDHTRLANEFLVSQQYDVLLHVVTSIEELSSHIIGNDDLPRQRIIAFNKIDNKIFDSTRSPEVVIKETVSRSRDHLSRYIADSEVMPTCVGTIAIVALAAQRWSDELMHQIILETTKAGDVKSLSKTTRLESIVDAANVPLRGKGEPITYKPGYPAVKLAMRMTLDEGLKTPHALRQRLLAVSGITNVRAAIENAILSPLVDMRREMLPSYIEAKRQLYQAEIKLFETKRLIQQASQLGSKHQLAHAQQTRFYADIRSFLKVQAGELTSMVVRQDKKIRDTQEEYIRRANKLASGLSPKVNHEIRKGVPSQLLGKIMNLIRNLHSSLKARSQTMLQQASQTARRGCNLIKKRKKQ